MKDLRLLSVLTALALCFTVGGLHADDEKTPPNRILFTTKNGDVDFPHAKHVERAKKDCDACHDTLFPQDNTAPLNWKAGLHKPAEKARTSCGACHRPDGEAFETLGNCTRCHTKKK